MWKVCSLCIFLSGHVYVLHSSILPHVTDKLASPSLRWSSSCPVDSLQRKNNNNRGGKWWTLNDCFSHFPPSILSFITILCVHWHPTDSRTYTHTPVWLVWLMRRDGRHGNSEPGVTVCDVTLTWFTLRAVQAQNRTGNKTFTVKFAAWNSSGPQCWLAVKLL